MNLTYTPNITNHAIELSKKTEKHNEGIATKVLEHFTDLDLLEYVKKNFGFFINHGIIDREWFARFEPEMLSFLNIFTKGSNNLVLNQTDMTVLVLDCHLSVDVMDESYAGISVYGKGYLDARLMGRSASFIKLNGNSAAEVSVSGYAVANITSGGKSNLKVENHDNSLVMVVNRSKGWLEHTGTDKLIIN